MFPRLTKCNFYQFGSSGDVQKYDTMCILSINILNEKIYIFLWFWFLFMAVVSAYAVSFQFVSLLFVQIRVYVTNSNCRIMKQNELKTVISKANIGDWFILNLFAKNIDQINFKRLIKELEKTKKYQL